MNLTESYLLKATIPFIRVAHLPRLPHLKLLGGNVCIQADLKHTMNRLNITSDTIIPVSFKRKLEYTGHYISQVINKEHVYNWLMFLMVNNHLYKNIKISKKELTEAIGKYSKTLLKEVVEYDEMRILRKKEENIESLNCGDEESETEVDDIIFNKAIEKKTSEN